MNTSIVLVLLLAVAFASAYPPPAKTRNFPYQEMLMPRMLPDEMYGPNYVWDNKGMPRRVDEINSVYYDSAPVHTDTRYNHFLQNSLNNAMSLVNTMAKPPRRNQNTNFYFPDSGHFHRDTASKPKDDDIEQRMLLPGGMEMPNDMYGPSYKWERKGWPTLLDPTARPSMPVYRPNGGGIVFRNR